MIFSRLSSRFDLAAVLRPLLAAWLLLFGCGSEPRSPQTTASSPDFSIPLAEPLTRLAPEGTALTAEVSVDGGAPMALAVDMPNQRVTGRIENVPPGRHTFTITFRINSLIVAIWSSEADVILGETTSLVIDAGSFQYPDDDQDGITNLAEIEAGTDPKNNQSPPRTTTPPPRDNTLAAAYGFSEGGGVTIADTSGNKNIGTLPGPRWTTAGKAGNALLFDAIGAVDLGNDPSLQITGSMTIEAWINPSAFLADDSGVVSKLGATGIDSGYQLDTTVDRGPRTIGFKLANPSGNFVIRYGKTPLVTGTWQHIAGVYNAAAQTMHVYLNGVLDDGDLIGEVAPSQRNSGQRVFIGRRASGQQGTEFSGTIDEVRIYNRALSQAEIQTDMTTPVGTPTANAPVAAYGLNEGSGATIADASGNNNIGHIISADPRWTAAGKEGNALLFSASGAVDLGNDPSLQITGSMTIEAWINPSAFPADDSGVVSKMGVDDRGYQLDTTVDRGPRTIGFKLADPSGNFVIRYGKTPLVTETWQHIAGVYDAAAQTMHVYLNGVLDDGDLIGVVAPSQRNSGQRVFIGKGAIGQPGTEFSGTIDEVRIYSRALSQTEIQTDRTTPVDTPTTPTSTTTTQP